MVDCAVPQISAIRSVFPNARTFYCHFHVAQLWEGRLREGKYPVSQAIDVVVKIYLDHLNKTYTHFTMSLLHFQAAVQESMRACYKKLLRASNKEGDEGVDNLWVQFQQDYGNRALTTYLRKNWFSEGEEPKWQMYYRQVSPIARLN